MTRSRAGRYAGGLAAAAAGIMWATMALAAPGSGKLCSLARDWVEGHCDGAKASRLATPARCARARDWLDSHCPNSKAQTSGEPAHRSDVKADPTPGKAREERVYRSEAKDETYARKAWENRESRAAGYEPAPRRKHADRSRKRVVTVYVERPRSCCRSERTVYYRTTPYRDQVFVTDHVLRPGKEAAFFRAHEANMR
jgi:hypothetical protein